MSATTEYVFTAFDLQTEFVAWDEVIPDAKLAEVWAAAGINVPPSEVLNCWPLQANEARAVAHILNHEVSGSEAHYFVEARER